ncbi:hypothetical protein D3C78_1094120 [compost metagenome]
MNQVQLACAIEIAVLDEQAREAAIYLGINELIADIFPRFICDFPFWTLLLENI